MNTRYSRASNETQSYKRNSTKLSSYLTLFALSGLAAIAFAAFPLKAVGHPRKLLQFT